MAPVFSPRRKLDRTARSSLGLRLSPTPAELSMPSPLTENWNVLAEGGHPSENVQACITTWGPAL